MKVNAIFEQFPYRVPANKRVRVIVNTDAANEADDQYAIVQALLTPKLNIRGFVATHFGTHRTDKSMEQSFDEIKRILELMDMSGDYPVYRGSVGRLDPDAPIVSEGAQFIIDEAMRDDAQEPLFAIFLGAITDLAAAYKAKPEIAGRLTAIWIGAGAYPHGGEEFNLGNDIAAADLVFGSDIPLWQVPRDVYKMPRVSLAELAVKVRPWGEIGEYLFRQLEEFNVLPIHSLSWPPGESWNLGDSPAVSLLIDDQNFDYELRPAPEIGEDMSYAHSGTRRPIRVYTSVDSRFILEDLYAKLQLFHELKGSGRGK
ncbi:nucleoside hydrolase [Cohnella sp. CIP 111063]|nr:nucleoside hydrolase [Cohnella sp. CIP 111063]PRX71590.1 inosine-uridine preferring nucleoside hydrolase [Cohnella sp. SGD-V74]